MISYVLVTLADPTAPDGTVALTRVPALVHVIHEDKTADVTVFSNAQLVASRGPSFFLEKVPLDVTKASAPSYVTDEVRPLVAATPAVLIPTAPAPTPAQAVGPATLAASTPPENVRRVFGKGTARLTSSRSSAPRRFESLGVAAAKGTATPEQLLRTVGSPKALLPGQQPPRVFVKGKGEVTSREHTDRPGASIDPSVDPMGSIEAMLNSPGNDAPAYDAPSVGEVPAPGPMPAELPPAAGPAPHANGTDRTRAGQPL
jgi:hypothetical protein